MIGKRKLLAELLFRAGALEATAPHPIVVLNYHRVYPCEIAPTPFDDGVYGPTAAELDAQLGWLATHCHVLDEDELCACAHDGRWPSGHNVALTFDDAYIDQFTIAWPLLRKHSLPAIFFVPTEPITERRLGWWDLIAWIVKHARREIVAFDGDRLPRAAAFTHCMRRMKLEPAERTRGLVERLARACDVELPDPSVQAAQLMTWEQLGEVARDPLIAIGSHTHTHRVLATLDAREQERELRVSRALLEDALGRAVRVLAYPVGHYAHFTPATQAIAHDAGYELGFSYRTGPNPAGPLDPFDVRRSSLGADSHELSLFAAAATWPSVFH